MAQPEPARSALTEIELHILATRSEIAIPWRRLIASDRAKLRELMGQDAAHHHERTYIGGPPPARVRRMQFAHEVRARAAGVHWDLVDFRDVYRRYGGLCGICCAPVGFDEFTIDHIVPISKGGAHLLPNLQPAHSTCNSRKGARLVETGHVR